MFSGLFYKQLWSMNLNEFYTIGYIRRVIGVKGEMGIKLDVDSPGRYKGLDAMVLVKDGSQSNVVLEQAVIRGEELVIRIKGTTTPEDAKKFVGSTCMLPLTALPKLNDRQFYFHEIPCYKVIDAVYGEIGIVKEVIERPMQPVIVIKHGFEEILIPVAGDIIQKVDRKEKVLHIQAPEGLIELYLRKSDEEE
jgi:16S rRNA processing protein RimM